MSANALRAEACVRACEGLPQDALDGGWTARGIGAYAASLEALLKHALVIHARVSADDPQHAVLMAWVQTVRATLRDPLSALPA